MENIFLLLLQPQTRSNNVNAQVIDGHVIPHHVLFTNPTPSDRNYETLAFNDNLKVYISFQTEEESNGKKSEYNYIYIYIRFKSSSSASKRSRQTLKNKFLNSPYVLC